jgi:hypothetical protein
MKSILAMTLCLLPVIPVSAETSFDGHYIGQRTVVRGARPTCPANGSASWRITDGQLAYRFWFGSVPVQVSADGTLKGETIYSPGHGRNAWARVVGRISNGLLEADAEWRACQLHFSLKKA